MEEEIPFKSMLENGKLTDEFLCNKLQEGQTVDVITRDNKHYHAVKVDGFNTDGLPPSECENSVPVSITHVRFNNVAFNITDIEKIIIKED